MLTVRQFWHNDLTVAISSCLAKKSSGMAVIAFSEFGRPAGVDDIQLLCPAFNEPFWQEQCSKPHDVEEGDKPSSIDTVKQFIIQNNNNNNRIHNSEGLTYFLVAFSSLSTFHSLKN